MIKSSIFYLHYLVPALRQQEARTDCSCVDISNNKNMFHLKLEELGNNVYLVVTALADKKRYILVCVCMLKAIHHQKFVLQTNNFKDKQYLLGTTVAIFLA
jgi:regulation of enolase protein 1 (concanavalin A-like superfamily)